MIQVAEGAIIIITENSNTETSFIASLLCFHTWECLDGVRLRRGCCASSCNHRSSAGASLRLELYGSTKSPIVTKNRATNESLTGKRCAEREDPEQPKHSCVPICTKQIATLIFILSTTVRLRTLGIRVIHSCRET